MLNLTAEQFAQRAFDLNLVDERRARIGMEALAARGTYPRTSFAICYCDKSSSRTTRWIACCGAKKRDSFMAITRCFIWSARVRSRVYRAVHKNSGKVVALKVLRKRYSDQPLETEKFMREGQMGSTLRHPNIVPILEVHSLRRTFFLVMAFVEGQSLREFVKIRGIIDPLEASEIMAGVTAGLAYAAEKGITHRDLKLSNVLISSDGRPQLVDFGLAAMSAGPGDPGGFSNTRTIDYAALEKATGVKKDDPRSDIYFAGCIYYQMVAGQPPLLDTRERLQRMSIGRFREVKPISEVLPDLPLAVEAVVTKSMELDVNKRYATPVEMLVDVQKAIKALKAEDEQDGARSKTARDLVKQTSLGSIMVVETSSAVQNALRSGLKKIGYKVLVIGDSDRAFRRILDESQSLSCVIVSIATLGKAGIELYKQLKGRRITMKLPVLLMLGKNQVHLLDQIKDPHTAAVAMPLRMSELRSRLAGLLDPSGQDVKSTSTSDA